MMSGLAVATMLTILFPPCLCAARFKVEAGGCAESAGVRGRRRSRK